MGRAISEVDAPPDRKSVDCVCRGHSCVPNPGLWWVPLTSVIERMNVQLQRVVYSLEYMMGSAVPSL